MTTPKRAKAADYIKSDRAILLACIGIALFFWLLLKLSKTFKTTSACTIEYVLPEGKTFVKAPIDKARVTLEGRGWDLMSHLLSRNEYNLRFTLADLPSQGINRSQMLEKVANQMGSVQVTDINEDYIPIQLEEVAKKTVAIDLQEVITFAEGFHQQAPIRLAPDSITLSGPRSLVDKITSWPTQVAEFQQVKGVINQEILLVQPENSQLKLSMEKTTLHIPVEQFTEKAMFIPVTVLNAPEDSLKIFPNRIKLTCILGLSEYNRIGPQDFQIEVDIKGVTLGTDKVSLPVQLTRSPQAASNITYSPKAVEFFVLEKKTVPEEAVEADIQ